MISDCFVKHHLYSKYYIKCMASFHCILLEPHTTGFTDSTADSLSVLPF